MTIRLRFLLSWLLVPACYAMDASDEKPTSSALTHTLCKEYSLWKQWTRRMDFEQRVLAGDEKIMTQQLRAFTPLAPDGLQFIWKDAQNIMAIPTIHQNPLHICDINSLDAATVYDSTIINPMILFAIEYGLVSYGYMRYILVHEAAHVKLANIFSSRKKILGLLCATTKKSELPTLAFAHESFNIFCVAAFASKYVRANTQLITDAMLYDIEAETDALALKMMDCHQCLEEVLEIFNNNPAPMDEIRIKKGYASSAQINARAHELAGKLCAWHSHGNH